jgi:hypothetical protein
MQVVALTHESSIMVHASVRHRMAKQFTPIHRGT